MKLRAQLGGANQIAEQNRELAALAVVAGLRGLRRRGLVESLRLGTAERMAAGAAEARAGIIGLLALRALDGPHRYWRTRTDSAGMPSTGFRKNAIRRAGTLGWPA